MHERIPEFAHPVSSGKMIGRHSVAGCNPVQEPSRREMASPAGCAFPELSQCDLEDGKHPDQVGPLQIVMTGQNISHAETPGWGHMRWIRLAHLQEIQGRRSACLAHTFAGLDLRDNFVRIHAALVRASTSLAKACSLQGSGQSIRESVSIFHSPSTRTSSNRLRDGKASTSTRP